MKENNIIAIRKRDITLAHKAFADLMQKTEIIINDDAKANPNNYKGLSPSQVETCSVKKIQLACANTPFNPEEVKLISGNKFPDIVAEDYYGIEVKSTTSDSWTSIGSSILETTRVQSVDDIYMLFGKLGGDVPEFKCRPYQDVLSEISITHSPRYLINMDLNQSETIFSKMGTTYDEFRQLEDPISCARKYYREKAIQANVLEMPWWLTSANVEEAHSFNIKLWNSLNQEHKKDLQAKCMILFPEALNPARNMAKYNNTTLWLCSYNQVVHPNIRDMYSAGGKITHADGVKLRTPVAQVFNIIVEHSERIKGMLTHPTIELEMLIQDYNPILLQSKNMYESWLDICCKYADSCNVPLREWIEAKPRFQFSK